jgi:hypothetical protein
MKFHKHFIQIPEKRCGAGGAPQFSSSSSSSSSPQPT